MKKLSRVVLTAAALSLVLGLTVTALSEAQEGPRGRKAGDKNAPAMAQRGKARLDLSDEQKATLNEMRTENRKQALLRRGEMADLRAQLQAEFLNDAIDEGKVRSLSKKISGLRSEADAARLEHRLAMRNLLTDEQRDQLKEMRMHAPGRGARGGQGFHRGRGERGMRGGQGFHRGHGECGMRGSQGFHRGHGGRGMRGGPGFNGEPGGRGPCGQGQGFQGQGDAPGDCPFGNDGPRGGFFGNADPEGGFGPWWMGPDADLDGEFGPWWMGPDVDLNDGPEAPPTPEPEGEATY